MTYMFGSFYVFITVICIVFAKQRQTKYERMSGYNVNIPCAVQGSSGISIGVKFDDISGQCTLVQYPWSEAYSSHYTYLKKKTAIELDKDDWFVIPHIGFVLYATGLPGLFGVGARLEVHFQLPTNSSWTSFHFVMLSGEIDPDDSTSYSLLTSIFFAHVQLFQGGAVFMDAFNGTGYEGFTTVDSSPFVDGVTHVIAFVAMETHMEILIDNDASLKRVLPFVGPPETCRTFGIEVYDQSMPVIKKIEFRDN